MSGRAGAVPALKSLPESRLPRFRALLCPRGSKPTAPTSFWSSLISVLWAAPRWQSPPPFLLKLCPHEVLQEASWPFPSPRLSARTRSCPMLLSLETGWPYPSVLDEVVGAGLTKQGASLGGVVARQLGMDKLEKIFYWQHSVRGVPQGPFFSVKRLQKNQNFSPSWGLRRLSISCEASMQTKPFGFLAYFIHMETWLWLPCSSGTLKSPAINASRGKKMHPGLCSEHRVSLNAECFGWALGENIFQ